MKSAAEPRSARLTRFAQETIELVNNAASKTESNRSEAVQTLQECEERLRKRWWDFRRGPAWNALALAWAEMDRTAALKLMGKVPRGLRRNALVRWNDAIPLSPEEWGVAHRYRYGGFAGMRFVLMEWDIAHPLGQAFDGVLPVLLNMLDNDRPTLRLPESLGKALARKLLPQINAVATAESEERKVEARREKALGRYLKLVGCMVEHSPDTAEWLMESVFTGTATSARFGQKWTGRFSALRQLINEWVAYPPLRDQALAFLANSAPKYLRDFCLSHWYARMPTSLEEALNAWKSLDEVVSDQVTSEAWFLVVLVLCGMGDEAMTVARLSPRAEELLPRLSRAWLCQHPDTASAAIRSEDVQDDFIGRFLLCRSMEERVKLLRERTSNGRESLPGEMWRQLDVTTWLRNGKGRESERNALCEFYSKTESKESQFLEYVRINGYTQYNYENVDPHLLAALTAWHNEHPEEVSSLLSRMWEVMRPDDETLRTDLLRNVILERCRTVFAARPESFDELFVKWVKTTMVDRAITWSDYQTTYRFSLKEWVPFLYCLLGAQAVASLSAKRCDDLISLAVKQYTAEEDIMTNAARLYASDKGLTVLKPPAPPKDPSHLKAWQLGVVEASMKEILGALIAADQKEDVDETA